MYKALLCILAILLVGSCSNINSNSDIKNSSSTCSSLTQTSEAKDNDVGGDHLQTDWEW